MSDKLILLGTHFMFREELGSRLRGEGFTVHPYDDIKDLEKRLDNQQPVLVITDLQHKQAGGIEAIKLTKQHNVNSLAIGEHEKKTVLDAARDTGADLVITNSQASKQIEQIVEKILG